MSIYTVLISAEQILMKDWQFGSCLKWKDLSLIILGPVPKWFVSWHWGWKLKCHIVSHLRITLKGLVLKWVFIAYSSFKCKIHLCTEYLQSLRLKRLSEGEAACVLVRIIRRDLRKNKKVQVAWRTLAKEKHCCRVKRWMFEGKGFASAWSCSICEG